MKKSHIYTKSGDQGMTSLIGGTRVSKFSIQIEAYGTVDELNANIGVLISLLKKIEDKQFILKIQRKLFSLGAYLATDFDKNKSKKNESTVTKEEIEELEQMINKIDSQLPKLKNFVIPGGQTASAVGHVCRTVCRRTERKIILLSKEICLDGNILSYFNRLSDYFFVLSRKINIEDHFDEQLW